MESYKLLLAFTGVFISLAAENTVFCEKNENSNIWAVIHTGLGQYAYSYGMEAACYRMHKILRQNGVPKSQIIVMTPDIAAYNPHNPLPGIIVHDTQGNFDDPWNRNVYNDVDIDYNTANLTPQIFYEILRGNETAVKNITGSKKVLKSGPKDNVLFFSVTLGGYGGILLNDRYALWADTFVPFLEDLKDQRHFNKMFVFLDASYAASSFDDYLNPKKNIIAHTMGGRYTPMYLVSPNFLLWAYTGTYGSTKFLASIESSLYSNDGTNDELSIFDHHLKARSYLDKGMDPANLYGSLRLGQEKLSTFFGDSSKSTSIPQQKIASAYVFGESKLNKSNLKTIEESLEENKFGSKDDLVKWETIANKLISKSIEDTPVTMAHLELPVEKLPRNKFTSYTKVIEHLRKTCYSEVNQILLLAKSNMFAQMFSLGIPAEKILNAAESVC